MLSASQKGQFSVRLHVSVNSSITLLAFTALYHVLFFSSPTLVYMYTDASNIRLHVTRRS